MSNETLWIGIFAIYIPSVLPIFYRLKSVMNISDEQERTQHQKKTMQYLTFWIAGFVFILVLKQIL